MNISSLPLPPYGDFGYVNRGQGGPTPEIRHRVQPAEESNDSQGSRSSTDRTLQGELLERSRAYTFGDPASNARQQQGDASRSRPTPQQRLDAEGLSRQARRALTAYLDNTGAPDPMELLVGVDDYV